MRRFMKRLYSMGGFVRGLGGLVKEVHEFVSTHFKLKDHFADAVDQEVVQEVADDADDEAADCGDHSLIDTRGEE